MKITARQELDRAYQFACGLLEKGAVDWSCAPWRATRSNEQNALLFGVMYGPIAEAMGYDVDDIHQYACGTFFGWVDRKVPKTPNNMAGIESVPFRTTTRDENGRRNVLDKKRFSEFVAHVERIAARAGVFIPLEAA